MVDPPLVVVVVVPALREAIALLLLLVRQASIMLRSLMMVLGRLRPKSLKRVWSVMPLWKQSMTSCSEMLAMVAVDGPCQKFNRQLLHLFMTFNHQT
jgi:hypothetical protein